MSQTFTDPASGRPYTVDPATGQSRWLDGPVLGQPQPFPGGYPQPPAKKIHRGRNIVLGVVGGFLLLGLLGALFGGEKSDQTSTASASSSSAAGAASSAPAAAAKPSSANAPAKASPKVPGIGAPVRDGKFEFTVLKVKPGVASIGNQYLNKKAQGQYVLVTIKVTNIGDKAQMFAGTNQKLYDAQGRKFDADDSAAMYLGDTNSFLNDINPGNGVTGIVAYDVPKGVNLAKIELHDSMFSGGVEVTLH